MKIAVSGASGTVGRALCKRLSGDSVFRISRPTSEPLGSLDSNRVEWVPERGLLDPQQMQSMDAVVHLAGHTVAGGRWSKREKQRIRDSRVAATEKLVAQLCRLEHPPQTFVCASAIGIYGNAGQRPVDETTPPGDDFLSRVAVDWEGACQPLRDRGVRVCHARLGIVLDQHGGALAKMLPLFRWMMGGVVGDGTQIVSWIALEDCVRAIDWLVKSSRAEGAYNLVAPNPVSNRQFTQTLANALGKPACLPVPAAMLKLVLGEMADAILLSSCNARPARLLTSGFDFKWPELEPFLFAELSASLPEAVSHA